MLKKEYIKDGNLVYNKDTEKPDEIYSVIENVGDAYERGDRSYISEKGELSYDIVHIVTGIKYKGICEHSGMTSTSLCPTTKEKVDLHLLTLEADASIVLAAAKKSHTDILLAMNRFEHFIEIKEEQAKILEIPRIKYRDQRGSLEESMKTVRDIISIKELLKYLNSRYGPGIEEIQFEYYGFDDRIKWDTYHVLQRKKGETAFTIAGMSNGQIL